MDHRHSVAGLYYTKAKKRQKERTKDDNIEASIHSYVSMRNLLLTMQKPVSPFGNSDVLYPCKRSQRQTSARSHFVLKKGEPPNRIPLSQGAELAPYLASHVTNETAEPRGFPRCPCHTFYVFNSQLFPYANPGFGPIIPLVGLFFVYLRLDYPGQHRDLPINPRGGLASLLFPLMTTTFCCCSILLYMCSMEP